MPRLFRTVRSGLIVALAAGFAVNTGCASAPTSLPGQPAPAAVVECHLHSFEPATVTIKAGQAVLWRNTTTLVWHTVTLDPSLAEKQEDVAMPTGAKTFDSGKISSGDSFEHVFDVPGTYKYFCQPHESHGMLGEVIVQPAS
jgi:plastocyanin